MIATDELRRRVEEELFHECDITEPFPPTGDLKVIPKGEEMSEDVIEYASAYGFTVQSVDPKIGTITFTLGV